LKIFHEKYQCWHTFEVQGFVNPGIVKLNKPSADFPKYYPGNPPGQPVIMTLGEHHTSVAGYDKKKEYYQKHVRDLEKKNPKDYDIKTPLPNHN
jgi:hypothetical protein